MLGREGLSRAMLATARPSCYTIGSMAHQCIFISVESKAAEANAICIGFNQILLNDKHQQLRIVKGQSLLVLSCLV